MTIASRIVAAAVAAGLGAGLAGGLAACTASSADVTPPNDPADCTGSDCRPAKLFWPTGLAISPDEAVMFVANANSDLTYNSGTVDVIDLAAKVDPLLDAWLGAATIPADGSCTQDLDFTETLVCSETQFLRTKSGVRIGSFATAIGVQDKGSGGDLRLIIPVRGDPSITWVDYAGAAGKLECSSNPDAVLPLCEDPWRLTQLRGDSSLPTIPDEPFDVFVDSGNEFAMVTHLTSGSVTLVDSPKAGTPVLTDLESGLFGADPYTGLIGASSVAGRTPGAAGDIVYVASHTEDRIQTFTVVRPAGGPALLDPGEFFFLNASGGQAGGSRDTRGLAFDATGKRLFALNRQPPAVAIYDTSLTSGGAPANVGLSAVDVCRDASRLILADAGDGLRAYVSCFDTGEVYVIDPRDGGQVIDVISVGRGPYDVVAATSKGRLYVTDYIENSIAAIDIRPGSPTRDRVVLRIGKPKSP